MKAGKSRPLSADKSAYLTAATGSNILDFIVPDKVTIAKKLAGSYLGQFYRTTMKANGLLTVGKVDDVLIVGRILSKDES